MSILLLHGKICKNWKKSFAPLHQRGSAWVACITSGLPADGFYCDKLLFVSGVVPGRWLMPVVYIVSFCSPECFSTFRNILKESVKIVFLGLIKTVILSWHSRNDCKTLKSCNLSAKHHFLLSAHFCWGLINKEWYLYIYTCTVLLMPNLNKNAPFASRVEHMLA